MSRNFSPFIDNKPGVLPEERYKAVCGIKRVGVKAFTSGDGIHWRQWKKDPIIDPDPFFALDSQNVAFWSEHEETYLLYFRTRVGGVRAIARATSEDFSNWSEPRLMEFGHEVTEHLYVNQTHPYYRAPHIYIALPARFAIGRAAMSDEEAQTLGIGVNDEGIGLWNNLSETVFMTSRGGNRYDWIFKEGFVKPGLDRRNWVGRSNYAGLGVVPTGKDEMSLYIDRHYTQPSNFLERLSLRVDGFVSVNAPHAGGEMATKPFIFEGSELYINYATGAGGHILVELQEESGKPVGGFTTVDSIRIIGDETERMVGWKGGSRVAELSGQPVRLRFVMKDADLYSIQFR